MSTIVSDLAADSPVTYDQIRDANKARTLAALLVTMTPQQRIGAAAIIAERRGVSISDALELFGRLIDEARETAQRAA